MALFVGDIREAAFDAWSAVVPHSENFEDAGLTPMLGDVVARRTAGRP